MTIFNEHVNDPDGLKHFGVKGMRWGVRKKRDSSPSKKSSKKAPEEKPSSAKASSSKERYKKAAREAQKSGTLKQEADALLANEQKSKAKHGISDESGVPQGPKGWRPTKKQVAYTALGAAYVGLVIYGHQSGKIKDLVPGERCSLNDFKHNVQASKIQSWGLSGYLQDSSFDQQEFTLAAGHTFHRLSTTAEDSFTGATYATHSVEDFNRYVSIFRHEKVTAQQFHHVTFKAEKDIKIPDLATRLDALKKTMRLGVDDETVLAQYKSMSGGSWSDSTSKSFFKELAKRGYGAIIDDMDAGVIGESPLVVFDTGSMSKKVASVLTDSQINAAENALTEIRNRKH